MEHALASQYKAVMKKLPSQNEEANVSATFVTSDEDSGLIQRTVLLNYRDFVDLGSPSEITVTIQPGDLRNP